MLKSLLGLLSLSRSQTSARKNLRSNSRGKSRNPAEEWRGAGEEKTFLPSCARQRFHGCGIASSPLSETFNRAFGSVRNDACINLFLWSVAESSREKRKKNAMDHAIGVGRRENERGRRRGRSSDDGREHFRRQFIWPVGTIKLFPPYHVKNNTAERAFLLEQRSAQRPPPRNVRLEKWKLALLTELSSRTVYPYLEAKRKNFDGY